MTLKEFDRQIGNLMAKDYPKLVGMTPVDFAGELEPLRSKAPDARGDSIPFVIVVKVEPITKAVSALGIEGVTGFKEMDADEVSAFEPIHEINIPQGPAYLIADVATGNETLDVTPDDALPRILASERSPLTIPEGIAVLTQFPDVLKTHNAFSMLGSRSGDRRVPALWISRKKPKFGWCWAGNPHTWLGSASCEDRVGA